MKQRDGGLLCPLILATCHAAGEEHQPFRFCLERTGGLVCAAGTRGGSKTAQNATTTCLEDVVQPGFPASQGDPASDAAKRSQPARLRDQSDKQAWTMAGWPKQGSGFN